MAKLNEPKLKGIDLHIKGENRQDAQNIMFEMRNMIREKKDIPYTVAQNLLDYLEYKYTHAYPLDDVQRIAQEAAVKILGDVLKGAPKHIVYNTALNAAAYYNLMLETRNIKKGEKTSCIQIIYEGWKKASKSCLEVTQYKDYVIVAIIAYGFMGNDIIKDFLICKNEELYNAVKHSLDKLK